MKKKIDKLTIEGKDYVPIDLIEQQQFEGDVKIVILQRGWSMVGVFEKNGSECKLHNASVIRRWGTSNGLGELAKNGPLENTKLDKCYGTVEFDYLTVIATIQCRREKWLNEL
jgi:hypothetical protein